MGILESVRSGGEEEPMGLVTKSWASEKPRKRKTQEMTAPVERKTEAEVRTFRKWDSL